MACLLAQNLAILGVRVIKKNLYRRYLCWHSWHTEKLKRKKIFYRLKSIRNRNVQYVINRHSFTIVIAVHRQAKRKKYGK